MDAILDAAMKKADAAEVFYLSKGSRSVGFENGELKRISEKESTGVGLRVLKDGRIGHVAASKLDDPDALADRAVELAALNEPVGFGFAAGMPPNEAQVPRAITASESSASSVTLWSMVTGLPSRSPTAPYTASVAMGTAPSTTRTYSPFFCSAVSSITSIAISPAAAITTG